MSTSSMRRLSREEILSQLRYELHDSLVEHPFFGLAIDHPLVEVLHLYEPECPNPDFPPGCIAHAANAEFSYKTERVSEAIANNDWCKFALLHVRSWRLHALLAARDHLGSQRELWPAVGLVWLDSRHIWKYMDEWHDVWSNPCRHREHVMDEEERKQLEHLPDELTVWRGVGREDAVQGLSWTLNREQAIWFAKRGGSECTPHLAQGRIRKKDARAFFPLRNEAEIVVLPEHVSLIDVKRL